jgi:hypothetical protein
MNRLQQMIGVILPEELQVKLAVPVTVVLYSEENKPVVSQEVISELRRNSPGGEADNSRSRGEIRYRSLPNLRLTDRDAMDFFFIVDEKGFTSSALTVTPEYVRFMARSRTPMPPAWFADGVADLFAASDFERNPVIVSPVEWGSEQETRKIRKDPDYPRALLPLSELFASGPGPEAQKPLRRAEALLFLRWALDGKTNARREALWKFVTRASAAPATEEMFRECFGLGYVDVQERLSDYLALAVDNPLRLTPGKIAPLPALEPRLATDAEVARLRGDWERLEIGYVKARFPELTQKYVDQARRTLMRAYDKGERDPRLLGVIGLCEVDAGNDAGARPYLEAAVAGGVVRPRVYFELSRLRYAEARTKPELPGGHLSAAQATEVLKPLAAAYRQAPPLVEIYELTADVWSRSVADFKRHNLDVLDEGVGFFPWNPRLIYQVAWLNAREGYKPEAEALITRGLGAGPDAAFKTRFEQLRTTLATVAQPAKQPPSQP